MYIGIDPSLTSTGVAVIDGTQIVAHKTFYTKKKHLPQRLAEVVANITLYCCKFDKIDKIVVERVNAHRQRYEVNSMTLYYMALGAIVSNLAIEFGGELIDVIAPTSKNKMYRRKLVTSKYTGLGKKYSEHIIDAVAIVDRFLKVKEENKK